jgi:hypothetical protein
MLAPVAASAIGAGTDPRSGSRPRGFAASGGETRAAVDRLRDCEHRADDSKRELRAALTTAFTTPFGNVTDAK